MRLFGDHAEDVSLIDNEKIFAVHFDIGSTVLRDEDLVALLDTEGDVVAIFVFSAGAKCDDFGFLRVW